MQQRKPSTPPPVPPAARPTTAAKPPVSAPVTNQTPPPPPVLVTVFAYVGLFCIAPISCVVGYVGGRGLPRFGEDPTCTDTKEDAKTEKKIAEPAPQAEKKTETPIAKETPTEAKSGVCPEDPKDIGREVKNKISLNLALGVVKKGLVKRARIIGNEKSVDESINILLSGDVADDRALSAGALMSIVAGDDPVRKDEMFKSQINTFNLSSTKFAESPTAWTSTCADLATVTESANKRAAGLGFTIQPSKP